MYSKTLVLARKIKNLFPKNLKYNLNKYYHFFKFFFQQHELLNYSIV